MFDVGGCMEINGLTLDWVKNNPNAAFERIMTLEDEIFKKIIPNEWEFVASPDESGLGRVVINKKYYGMPMVVVNFLIGLKGNGRG